MENPLDSRACKIHNLRKHVDMLTNIMIIQLNKINRLLIELKKKTNSRLGFSY